MKKDDDEHFVISFAVSYLDDVANIYYFLILNLNFNLSQENCFKNFTEL